MKNLIFILAFGIIYMNGAASDTPEGTPEYVSVGCFKDSWIRAISGGYSTHRRDPIRHCFNEAKRKGFKYFAVQHGEQCFTSDDAEFTYNKYGKSNGCQGGWGGSWAMNVYKVVGEYTHVGCFKDTWARAISGGYRTYHRNPISKCFNEAKKKGFEYFAVQNNNQCFTSDDAKLTYKKYGKSNGCKHGEGGSWAMNVYAVIGVEPKTCIEKKCKDKMNFAAVGCFNDWLAPMESMDFLFNARTSIKWDKDGFKSYVCGVVCRCAQAAKQEGYKFFSIRFIGECHAGKDQAGMTEAMKDKAKKSKACIKGDGSYRGCDNSDECVGRERTDYIYSL